MLELAGPPSDYRLWRAFETSPVAERLHTVGNVPLEWLAVSPPLVRLRELVLNGREPLTDAHIAFVGAHPSLRVRGEVFGVGELTVGRDGDGTIAASLRPRFLHVAAWAQQPWARNALARLGAELIQRLTVVLGDEKPKGTDALVSVLESWMETLEALRDFDLSAIGGPKGTRRPKRATVELPSPGAALRRVADVRRIDWSEAGLVVARRRGLSLVDPERGDILAAHVGSDEPTCAVRRDGVVCYVKTLVDPRSGAVVAELPALAGAPAGATRDGRHLWTYRNEIVDLESGRRDALPKTEGGVVAVDDAITRCVASYDNALSLYAIGTKERPRQLAKTTSGLVWFSADGERLLVVEAPATVRALSLVDGAELFATVVSNSNRGVSGSAVCDGAIAIASGDTLALIDDRTGDFRWTRTLKAPIRIALSPDASRLFVVTHDALTAYDGDGNPLWFMPATLG